jgi:hypothetical protein
MRIRVRDGADASYGLFEIYATIYRYLTAFKHLPAPESPKGETYRRELEFDAN